MRCELSPKAQRDLREIGDYIARDNPTRAETFIAELVVRGTSVVDAPRGYAVRDELAPGLRSCAHGHYVIFFSLTPPGVRIERVIHGARLITEDDFTSL